MISVCVKEASENSMKRPMRLNDCSGYMIMPFQDHCFCSNQTGTFRNNVVLFSLSKMATSDTCVESLYLFVCVEA